MPPGPGGRQSLGHCALLCQEAAAERGAGAQQLRLGGFRGADAQRDVIHGAPGKTHAFPGEQQRLLGRGHGHEAPGNLGQHVQLGHLPLDGQEFKARFSGSAPRLPLSAQLDHLGQGKGGLGSVQATEVPRAQRVLELERGFRGRPLAGLGDPRVLRLHGIGEPGQCGIGSQGAPDGLPEGQRTRAGGGGVHRLRTGRCRGTQGKRQSGNQQARTSGARSKQKHGGLPACGPHGCAARRQRRIAGRLGGRPPEGWPKVER